MAKNREIEVSEDGDVLVRFSQGERHVWIDCDRYLALRIERGTGGSYKIEAFRSGSEGGEDPRLSVIVNVGSSRGF